MSLSRGDDRVRSATRTVDNALRRRIGVHALWRTLGTDGTTGCEQKRYKG